MGKEKIRAGLFSVKANKRKWCERDRRKFIEMGRIFSRNVWGGRRRNSAPDGRNQPTHAENKEP